MVNIGANHGLVMVNDSLMVCDSVHTAIWNHLNRIPKVEDDWW